MTSPSEELHWDPETVRKNAYKAVDWVVDYLSGVESRPNYFAFQDRRAWRYGVTR